MSVSFNPEVFREYDIRGHADRDLTDELALALGKAFGTRIRRLTAQGPLRVALGRDCRLSSPRLYAAFEAGVLSTGVDVLQLGVVPSPVLYFALFHLEVAGGGTITGSHNPKEWNGFKLCEGHDAIYGDAVADLRRLVETEDFEQGQGIATPVDIGRPYHDFVVSNIKPGSRRIKVVVDAGNGTGGLFSPAIYRDLGFEVIELFCEPDGHFPNHHPDPTVEKNLKQLKAAVAEHGADLGLGFDGDADRIGAVDHTGRVVWVDQLTLLFADGVLERCPNALILGDVKCSSILFDGIAKKGGQPEMWKVGHSIMKARIKASGAKLAGEMSGHIFFNDGRFFGFDDGPYVGARLMELLSHGEASLAELVDALPKMVNTPEIRVPCPDSAKFAIMEKAVPHFRARYRVFDLDGIRIDFPHGWGLLRPSNTQPVMVMRFEADSVLHLNEIQAEVESWLRTNAPEVELGAHP